MNVAIVGSRKYPNEMQVAQYVFDLPDDTIVVSGGAPGVDTWAEMAARIRGLGVLVFAVPKGAHLQVPFAVAAKARNAKIVAHADRVVAFHHDNSPGTASTLRMARMAGKEILVFTVGEPPYNQDIQKL